MKFEPKKCDDCKDQYTCEKPFDHKKDCQDQILVANVYTDGLRLVGDSIQILHNFAQKIYLPISHYYDKEIPMYYLPDWKFKELAIQAHAIQVPSYAIEIIGIFTDGRVIYYRETLKPIKRGDE